MTGRVDVANAASDTAIATGSNCSIEQKVWPSEIWEAGSAVRTQPHGLWFDPGCRTGDNWFQPSIPTVYLTMP
eukprot:7382373-Prymnesium_polylepis.4